MGPKGFISDMHWTNSMLASNTLRERRIDHAMQPKHLVWLPLNHFTLATETKCNCLLTGLSNHVMSHMQGGMFQHLHMPAWDLG